MNVQLCPCTVYTFQAWFAPPLPKKSAVYGKSCCHRFRIQSGELCSWLHNGGEFLVKSLSELEELDFTGLLLFCCPCRVCGGVWEPLHQSAALSCIRSPPTHSELLSLLLLHRIACISLCFCPLCLQGNIITLSALQAQKRRFLSVSEPLPLLLVH